MWHSFAADAVMLIHFAFIAFALLGSFLVLWKRWVVWLHLPALAWGAWIEASGNICPLTPLENRYRALAGESTYGEGFISHYLTPLIYPEGLTRGYAVRDSRHPRCRKPHRLRTRHRAPLEGNV